MIARYSARSTSRSSRARNFRAAAWNSERGVPPSPNMMQCYQTDVRVSTMYLQNMSPASLTLALSRFAGEGTSHPNLESNPAPPQLPLPSPHRNLESNPAPPQLHLHSPHQIGR